MSAENFRFSESDSLLCYHGPMLYEAKCLKRRKSNDGKAQYFIHYKGWNSKWEEWVDDERVLAVNVANMNKMASLKEFHSSSKKGVTKRSITITKEEPIRNTTPPVKAKKRKHSEISTESDQITNVPSPSEPKPKKRGRPPKSIPNYKSELTEAIDETEPSEIVVSVKTEVTESEKSEIIEEAKATERTDVNKEKNETPGTNKTDVAVFIVPAPVTKTIPVVNMPLVLKNRLAYDKMMITKFNKVLKFPNKITVEKLIRSFVCANQDSEILQRERAFNIGLTLMQYFNLRIHKDILYLEELKYGIIDKAQICLTKKIFKKSIRFHFRNKLFPKNLLHHVYGPTFLLRLFVELPKHLSTLMYNEKQIMFIVENLDNFLKFVENNYDKYFSESDYIAIDEDK